MENLDNTTHRVVVTIGSVDEQGEVGVRINLDPEMTGEEIVALGYQPASHQFLEKVILPMLEEVFMKTNADVLNGLEGPTRTVN